MAAPSCYDKAVELLARRAHLRRELEVKLDRRGYPSQEIAAVLNLLAERGYLDDRRTARDLVAARLQRGGLGRRRLLAELQRKGVEPELAAEVLAEAVPEDDLAQARRAAERWVAARRGPSKPEALGRHLDRKGYSRRAIFTILEELAAHDEPDDEQ